MSKQLKVEGNCWKFKFWRLPHIEKLELFYGYDVNYEYPLHMHEEHAIVLVLQGMDITYHRGEIHTARAGDLLLVNAGEVHTSRSIGTEYRIMNVHPDLLTRIAIEVFGRALGTPNFPERIMTDASLCRVLTRLHLKLEENRSPLEQEVEFLSKIGLLLQHQHKSALVESAPNEPRYVEMIRDYLNSHYTENVTLTQLTSITNLSPFYLIRAFRHQTGVPPHEFQTQLRIAHAKKLLRGGSSILDAALQTGFFDQSHLSRNFKRIVGVTPGQYVLQGKIVQDRV